MSPELAQKWTLGVILSGVIAVGGAGGMFVKWAIDTDQALSQTAHAQAISIIEDNQWKIAWMKRVRRLERKLGVAAAKAESLEVAKSESEQGLFRRLLRRLF